MLKSVLVVLALLIVGGAVLFVYVYFDDSVVEVKEGRAEKPILHGRHWVAITGKPLAATAGAKIFERGGNAVDAACAMLGAACTMFDALSWGGETQALIYNPHTKKVHGINALGAAPTGATPGYFKKRGMAYPPEYGPLAAVTPGTPGGLMVMLAEFGTKSLKEVLQPALEMAGGYPVEKALARSIEKHKDKIREWPYSKRIFLTPNGEEYEAPRPGGILRQEDLQQTLTKLIEAEQTALAFGKNRKEAIYAAYDRFYLGDIAAEFVRGSQEQGGLHTLQDLARWQVFVEEPVMTTYKGIEVYKLNCWVQGPVMLQALNILENLDVKSLGYNSAKYIHALYQTMNLVFADRDFYYGDPYYPPEEPIAGLLSKEYAKDRLKQIDWRKNKADVKPGDPYLYEGKENPFLHLLRDWSNVDTVNTAMMNEEEKSRYERGFLASTTTIQAAGKDGWVVSITPSGGWMPACIAGNTGIGMSQRMQSFILDERKNPFNVLEPGKRPRATLTPGLALKDGKPFLSFAVQGGDTQDQNLLQFFLNIVEFGMNVQQACEAQNIHSYQMQSSFGEHLATPGKLQLNEKTPWRIRAKLKTMGYQVETKEKTSGPINAIFFDRKHNTFWGGSSNYGEDYGIAW